MPSIFELPSFDLEELTPEQKIRYHVVQLGEQNLISGRELFSVKCLRCGKIVHECTNGPQHHIRSHEDIGWAKHFLGCNQISFEEWKNGLKNG